MCLLYEKLCLESSILIKLAAKQYKYRRIGKYQNDKRTLFVSIEKSVDIFLHAVQ